MSEGTDGCLDVVCARCNHHSDHHEHSGTYGLCKWKQCECGCLVQPSDGVVLDDKPKLAESRFVMPLNISREAEGLLLWLLASGLYGRDIEETAERVICVGLEALLLRPVLEPARTDLHRRQHAKVMR